MGEVSVLLDTHTLLWWLDDDRHLSRKARATIASASTIVYVSAVSLWEIAIKHALGKLAGEASAIARLPMIVAERGMLEMPISGAHAIEAGSLPRLHRDPFDRMLVAQSRLEAVPVVTNDRAIRKYGVKTIW